MSFWDSAIAPDHEPERILIARGAFTDEGRAGRSVPWKIYYPPEWAESVPVIVWSHGLGGTRDGGGFIHRFVAAHGFVVVCLQHPGTDSSLWEGKPGHPWDAIRAAKIPRKAVLDRYRDIPFALGQLDNFAQTNPELFRHMDLARLGMAGHSFGAATTQLMAGQMRGFGKHRYSLREKRFSCGILYSPVPSANRKDSPRTIYGPIATPLFHMTGTQDTSPVEGFDYTRRLEVFENNDAPEQSLLILEGGDHMIYNGSRGKLEENPKRETLEEIVKIASLAFWEAYLKQNNAAKAWLCGGGFAAWLDGGGTYAYRP